MAWKSDFASSYIYTGPSGPNAVDSIARVGGGSVNYGYDNNGILTTVNDQSPANFDKAITDRAFTD